MTTINLKDFYAWYTHDEYIEVSDEVAAELKADKLYEAAYQRRTTRNKAQYSLDCDDGIEYSACRMSRPRRSFWSAWSCSFTSGTPSTLCQRCRASGWRRI